MVKLVNEIEIYMDKEIIFTSCDSANLPKNVSIRLISNITKKING